ncbi:hypothetical protein BDW02DRAFT_593240 [Decorospora gaudefroyi]|uniref:Uncharacterized protein n=1 Tax=Decorospora gaudefroyi TaxID=184978 RepID=A0A6A5K1Y7_9PLEO|nr:hypothetical protein BDW02DRAFT_593240 [Decorospora gaudefroyi]
MDRTEAETANPLVLQSVATLKGSLDHVLDVLASHHHPFLLVGCAAQRWMGSLGTMTDICEILIRDNMLNAIGSDLLATGIWKIDEPDPERPFGHDRVSKCDADLVLQRIRPENENEFYYLALWFETTYHIDVDSYAAIQVPDIYSWQPILVEESWHPAMHRDNGWWYGPRVHPDTKVPNAPPRSVHPNAIFFPGFPRGRSENHPQPILFPNLITYLDALIYHITYYKTSKPGLWSVSSWLLSNLTRYLYLELDHQQLPLLIELEGYEFMEGYLRRYVRKPRFVYRTDEKGEFEATRGREWEPESFPQWCGTMK